MKNYNSVRTNVMLNTLVSASQSLSSAVNTLFNMGQNVSRKSNVNNIKSSPIRNDWIRIGNDMRRGIIKYDRSIAKR